MVVGLHSPQRYENNRICFLFVQCYSLHDRDNEKNRKLAIKGVSKHTNIRHDEFLQSLYSASGYQVIQTRMQFDKRLGMTIKQQKKNGLNCIYTKMKVGDDLVTISPLSKNNELI